MKHSCDVCFTTTGYDIDEVVLDYWIAGYDDIDYGCMLAEVEDAFRLFQLTSKYMESPPRLCEQRLLPLTTPMCEMLISKYYEIDDVVLREIVGKKPSTKLKKEASEICLRANINYYSCRRQSYCKVVINIGMELSQGRELRDFFVDIFENIIIPCHEGRWTKDDLRKFCFELMKELSDMLLKLKQDSFLVDIWNRYLDVFTVCVTQML
ncbi:hypothetical protein D917_06230 [Trichinella nativa]|uniref:Acidic fibroblast growth factor intracellular-binding protein n=1 Tax=Trichinella nativa TaxID=6335 RepID=A0A1Y3EWZ8_9BILA|nr:hypothetical protein D917_06230 [Trichinella nativa]